MPCGPCPPCSKQPQPPKTNSLGITAPLYRGASAPLRRPATSTPVEGRADALRYMCAPLQVAQTTKNQLVMHHCPPPCTAGHLPRLEGLLPVPPSRAGRMCHAEAQRRRMPCGTCPPRSKQSQPPKTNSLWITAPLYRGASAPLRRPATSTPVESRADALRYMSARSKQPKPSQNRLVMHHIRSELAYPE